MDTKLPHILDYKPSATEPIKPPPTIGKSAFSQKKKLSLAIMAGLVALVGLSMLAIGSPLTLYKRASTDATMKDGAYNANVYQLSCPSPNFWVVPEANPAACDPNNATLKCGEVCPADRQTGTVNPEGHTCCRPPDDVKIPPPPVTPEPPKDTPAPPRDTPVPPTGTPLATQTVVPTTCPAPHAVDELTVFCPACQGGQ